MFRNRGSGGVGRCDTQHIRPGTIDDHFKFGLHARRTQVTRRTQDTGDRSQPWGRRSFPMPWKKIFTVERRAKLVSAILARDASVAEMCPSYGISRETAYKWTERHNACSRGGSCHRRTFVTCSAYSFILRGCKPKRLPRWHSDCRDPGLSMGVKYFRKRRNGPERHLEDAVAAWYLSAHSNPEELLWVGGSLSVGAGMPDLSFVHSHACVLELGRIDPRAVAIMSHLRSHNRRSRKWLNERLGYPESHVHRVLEQLSKRGVVEEEDDVFQLGPCWIRILKNVVTVEAKVSDWRAAAVQANRNRIFSHQSFVAMPQGVAERVCDDEVFHCTGVGVLGIDPDGCVRQLRSARRTSPKVWEYYYSIAFAIATTWRRPAHALSGSHQRCCQAVS